jgi:chromosome partitioning protein
VAAIQETCSVCGNGFDVVFRYQMEERDDAFVFFCSQECLGSSQRGNASVTCEACAKRFAVTLASQVFYAGGRRRYACSMPCRTQLVREEQGARLGEIAAPEEPERERVSEIRALRNAELPPPMPSVPAATIPAAPRRIAVFNHKGGTGKTTTSVSLAAGLAARGQRVLLVDTDSQGNVAVSLGASCERSLYHVLVMGLAVADAVQKVRPGLDLLPSNETLAAAELYLAGRQNRDRVLSQRMGDIGDAYDFVIVDCSPSLSLMNQNALVLADGVLVPVACDYLSLVGVRQVIRTVKNVNTLLRHPLQIWGVLPTFYDARAKICVEALETLRSHFGERCLAPVRISTKLKEAPAQALSIFEHAPGTNAAQDYDAVCEALVATTQLEARRQRRGTEAGR